MVKCPFLSSTFLVCVPGTAFFSAEDPKVHRRLEAVEGGLTESLLRPTESPEFLESTEQLRNKSLCGAGAVSENIL